MSSNMPAVCVAFKAHQGWLNAVGVDAGSSTPLPLVALRIDLVSGNNRTISEPYHVAGGWHGLEQVPLPKDPAATVCQGRKAQVQAAKNRLSAFSMDLRSAGWRWARAVVLTGRGRLGDDLAQILSSHSKIHIAEGEAIRDATRAALEALKVVRVDQDEKSILVGVGDRLKIDQDQCDEMMKPLKPQGAKVWRKEERLLALGAWLNKA